MVVQSSIGLIETYFIAKLGTDALAGMALVFPILMLVQMVSGRGNGRRHPLGGRPRARPGPARPGRRIGLARGGDRGGLGIATTLAALLAGPALYRLMGGSGGSLAAATTYSDVVFAGAILLWLFNSLAAIIRGAGNMTMPASVTATGAVVLIPLSPALIFGWGPLPHLGIVGGAVAVLFYYAIGSIVFAAYLWSGRTVVRPPLASRAVALGAAARDLAGRRAVSSLISVSTNLSIATATGFAGRFGAAAVAGYGTGARLEYVLVPLVFGLGSPLAAMVGTAMGAGRHDRALRVAWTGAAIAALMTEAAAATTAARKADTGGDTDDDGGERNIGHRQRRRSR